MSIDANRPYFKNSILQLEALFDQAQSNLESLRALDQELSHRATARAAKLRSRVADLLATLAVGQVSAVVGAGSRIGSSAIPTVAVITLPRNPMREQPPQPSQKQERATASVVLPPPEDIGDLPSFAAPKYANEPTAVLATWIALEALSPQGYRRPEDLAAGDRRCVADLSTGHVPWGMGERSRPKKQLHYQVILGSIPMGRATEDLVKAFGDDEERSPRSREKAAIGAILVDKDGVVAEENGITASSFAWALPLALKLNLAALGAWPKIEPKIIEKLDSIVRRVDREGKPIPLDLPTIDKAYRWLVAQFGLPDHLVEPPTFALRVYHYYKAKNPPEASLLNSFFLGDLARGAALVGENAAPAGLRRYLGIERPKETFDLLDDEAALEKAVAPAMMPAARWPSPSGHPLVLLQQAAVNLARSELAGGEGIIAVNGPPGTGKTTLLRDIVAACVLDRALAMAAFDDPEKAFTPSGQKMSAGEKAFFHLYGLDSSLKGHEILVASSNNKAVENVSKELPSTKAIGRTTDELSYFKSVSDLVHGPREVADGDDDELTADPVETWGLIAAVLGNAKNRAAFQQSFWWHDDRGFRLYLKAAKGDSVVREIKDLDTGKIIERWTPSVVLNEKPPSPQEAKIIWRKARVRLLAMKREIDAELKTLEDTRQLCLQLADARRDIAKSEAMLAALVSQRPALDMTAVRRRGDVENAQTERARRAADVQRHRKIRAGFVARLFGTRRWKAWSNANTPLMDAEAVAIRQFSAAEQILGEATAALNALTANIHKTEESLAGPRQQVAQLSQSVEVQRRILGDRLVDERFFARDHEASNLTAPWIPDSLHRKREDLLLRP